MTSLNSPLTPGAHASSTAPKPEAPEAAETQPMAGEPNEHVSIFERVITLFFVFVPVAAVIVAVTSLWGVGVDWIHLILMFAMICITGLGISVGYHRLFSHRAFKTFEFVRVLFAIAGAMALEGTVRGFVATHRRHHSQSDRPGDPHTPHNHDGGVWNMVKGFWFAHMGWFLRDRPSPDIKKYAPEYCKPSGVRVVDQTNGVWVVLGLILPAAIAGFWGGTWLSALLGLIWGGGVRVFLVHHLTWSVNSICHLWGTRPFKSGDHSRNNPIFGYLGFGEGWHNNHHAFPFSSRHGLRWWEFDAGYILIRTLALFRLAWDVRVPSKARLEAVKKAG